jgi:flagellar basal body-associated protein FliL
LPPNENSGIKSGSQIAAIVVGVVIFVGLAGAITFKFFASGAAASAASTGAAEAPASSA